MIIYVVKKGDTLSSIARKYHISVGSLVDINQIEDPDVLVIGQSLIVPKANSTYLVKPGDTLGGIAAKNNVSIQELLLANIDLTPPYALKPGQVINLESSKKDKMSIRLNGYCYNNTPLEVIEKSLPYLTTLSIFSYHIKENGELYEQDEKSIIELAKKYNIAPIMVVTNTKENGSFDSEISSKVLESNEAQDRLIKNIISIMKEKGYKGINIDFEYIYPKNKDAYFSFISKLEKEVKQSGDYLTSLALAPKYSKDQKGLLYESHDYPRLANEVDYVIIMTYEWGYTYGPAMPVAPIDLVEKVISYATSEMPSSSILLGVPNYGYDFALPYEKGKAAKSITNASSINYAYEKKAEIHYDNDAQTPYFEYYDKNKKKHIVYFEDARSIKAKCRLVEDFSLGGMSIWTISSFYNPLFEMITYYFNIEKLM